MGKTFEATRSARNKIAKPAVNLTAPFSGKVVGAKTKKSQLAQATTNISKSITRYKILCLTIKHGNGLRSKVM